MSEPSKITEAALRLSTAIDRLNESRRVSKAASQAEFDAEQDWKSAKAAFCQLIGTDEHLTPHILASETVAVAMVGAGIRAVRG